MSFGETGKLLVGNTCRVVGKVVDREVVGTARDRRFALLTTNRSSQEKTFGFRVCEFGVLKPQKEAKVRKNAQKTDKKWKSKQKSRTYPREPSRFLSVTGGNHLYTH